jgi:hypothetical protein
MRARGWTAQEQASVRQPLRIPMGHPMNRHDTRTAGETDQRRGDGRRGLSWLVCMVALTALLCPAIVQAQTSEEIEYYATDALAHSPRLHETDRSRLRATLSERRDRPREPKPEGRMATPFGSGRCASSSMHRAT